MSPSPDAFAPARFAQQLTRAIAQGVALASLAGFASCSSDTSDERSPGTNLSPYTSEDIGCWGPQHDGGYYGQCCVDAQCYTPEAGESCLPAESVGSEVLPSFPPGSGECNCYVAEGASTGVLGPYAPNSTHSPKTPGTCCYLVGSIACEGRPLIVDGAPLLAALTARSDWAPFA